MAKMEVLHLTRTERGELQSYLRERNLPANVSVAHAHRSLLNEGKAYCDIEEKLRAAPSTVSRWKQRYNKDGVPYIPASTSETHAAVAGASVGVGPASAGLAFNLSPVSNAGRVSPPDGSTHWWLRKMGAMMMVKKNPVTRIWKEVDLKPHQLDRYMPPTIHSLKRRRLRSMVCN